MSNDPSMLRHIDWRQISCSDSFLSMTCKKKISVSSFYVKDLSVWLPHVIIPDCVPTCYRCLSKFGVDVGSFRWVENPKILYDIHSHRYLDTVYYKCHTCGGAEFAATREETLQIDSQEVTGILNFRLSSGFGVDEELYSFIVSHSTDTTSSTYQRIKDMHADHWVNYATLHYRAVLAKRTKPTSHVRHAQSAPAITQRESPELKQRNALRWEHTTLIRLVTLKQSAFDGDINFLNICRRKENRNSIGEIFPGIGKVKCQTLASRGVNTAKQLLEYEGDDPCIKYSWKAIVHKHYETLESELACLKSKCESTLTDLDIHVSIFGDVSADGAALTAKRTTNQPINEKPPRFSLLRDPIGFNCRVVSRQTTNRTHMADFQRRRLLQQGKMRSMKSCIWKIDWHYKLASKIKVCTGRGKCFSPHTSALTVQNEDALTVFWKFFEGAECIEMARKDLILLRHRNKLLCANDANHDGRVDLCWVGNCCIVRPKLKSILGPSLEVKLDVFHWQERWNDVLYRKEQ